MYKGFCHTCQEFLETPNKFCEKCGMMLEILQRVEATQHETSVFNPNTSTNQANTLPNSSVAFHNQNYQNAQTNTVNNFQSSPHNQYQNNYSQPNNQNFQGNYSANQRNYNQPHYTQNNGFSAKTENVSGKNAVIKFLLIAIILCGLGYGVNYAKNYFAAMPEQRINNILKGDKTDNTAQTATQTPWFWDFFRKEPTADEVFEKYEKETMVESQNVSFQTMTMKGKLTFIPHNPNSPIAKLKPLHKFNTEMEMSMKLPDKVLVKMNMTLKGPTLEESLSMYPAERERMEKAVQSFRATVIAGVNGKEKWAVNNMSFNGNTKTEEKNDNNDFDELLGKTNNLTMTFSRQMYERIEFVGTDIVEGRKTYLLKGIKPDTNADLLYFDIETGLVVKYFSKNSEVFINGYNTFEGVKMPSSMRLKTISDMDFQIDVQEMKKDVPLEDSIFLRSSY